MGFVPTEPINVRTIFEVRRWTGTQKIWAVSASRPTPTLPFLQNFYGLCSDRPALCTKVHRAVKTAMLMLLAILAKLLFVNEDDTRSRNLIVQETCARNFTLMHVTMQNFCAVWLVGCV